MNMMYTSIYYKICQLPTGANGALLTGQTLSPIRENQVDYVICKVL